MSVDKTNLQIELTQVRDYIKLWVDKKIESLKSDTHYKDLKYSIHIDNVNQFWDNEELIGNPEIDNSDTRMISETIYSADGISGTISHTHTNDDSNFKTDTVHNEIGIHGDAGIAFPPVDVKLGADAKHTHDKKTEETDKQLDTFKIEMPLPQHTVQIREVVNPKKKQFANFSRLRINGPATISFSHAVAYDNQSCTLSKNGYLDKNLCLSVTKLFDDLKRTDGFETPWEVAKAKNRLSRLVWVWFSGPTRVKLSWQENGDIKKGTGIRTELKKIRENNSAMLDDNTSETPKKSFTPSQTPEKALPSQTMFDKNKLTRENRIKLQSARELIIIVSSNKYSQNRNIKDLSDELNEIVEQHYIKKEILTDSDIKSLDDLISDITFFKTEVDEKTEANSPPAPQ